MVGRGEWRVGLRIAAVVAVLFGLLTIVGGASVLFGGDAVAQAAGRVVAFVLWFNFLAGFAYVAAGLGLWSRRRWAAPLAIAIAASTLAVFAAFGLHVAAGGAYEPRTVAAMALRCGVWILIALAARRLVRQAP